MRRFTSVLLCAGLLGILLLGCGETATPTKVGETGAGTSGAEGGSTTPATQAYKAGDKVKIGNMVVTLNKVRRLPNTTFNKPSDSKNIFVAADFTFENTGSEAENVSSLLQISMQDDSGYAAQQTIHTKAKTLKEGEIGPGRKSSGEIAYEVPKSVKGLQILYDASLLDAGQIIWDVGNASSIK